MIVNANECKNYHKFEENYIWNPRVCICENSKYLKLVKDTSVTNCDDIVIAIDNLSTKKTDTIGTNVTSTASINCHHKKVRDILLLISDHITIDNYYYFLSLCKTKR